jgi:hypothetical protein
MASAVARHMLAPVGGTISALEAAWAKFQRAQQDLAALDRDVERFLESQPYRVEVRFDADSGWHVAHLRILAEPPAALSVHVGSLAHQCYSALNHVVWRLVERKMGTKRAEARKLRVAMPLCTSAEAFAKNFTARHVSKAARGVLESLQPYHRPDRRNWIALLKELADADKHRVLPPSYGVGELWEVLNGEAYEWDDSLASDPTAERLLPAHRDPFTIPEDAVQDGAALLRVRFASGNERADLHVREQPTVELVFESDTVGIFHSQLRPMVDFAGHYLACLATLFPAESWPPGDPE